MVGRYATPEAETTITHHLPPLEDDSTQDVSLSFVIPPQADASNLLDQNYDDFLAGQGFVTLSTPVPPRHLLLNARESARKATRIPMAASRPILGQRTRSTADLEPPNERPDPVEAHTPPHSSRTLLQPTNSFTSTDPPTTAPAVGAASTIGPGSPRPGEASPESNPDEGIYNGLKPNTALSAGCIVTTIQSMPTSAASRHSVNTQNAQISRPPPIPAPPKRDKEPGQTRGSADVKSIQARSKLRSGDVPVCKTTATSVSCDQLCQPSWDMRIAGWSRMARL